MRGLAITRRATSPQLIPLGREEDAGTTRQVWYSACSANLHIVEGLRLHSEHHPQVSFLCSRGEMVFQLIPQPLPPTFTSLYRLFLRTTSASVLCHRRTTRQLRKLWKPTFVGAAQMIRRLQNEQLGDDQREMLICWYEEWQRRMDNTLSLQVASAKSRGLPHLLIRNIALLSDSHRDLSSNPYVTMQYWKGQLPPDSPEYQPKAVRVGSRVNHRDEKRSKWMKVTSAAWSALGEVVRMAEAKDSLSLGRLTDEGRRS